MSDNSAIEWTDASWNPVTGCTKVSPGCDHCYAETFAERFRGVPGHHFERGFDVVLRPERLEQPTRWRRPRRIFVNSMSDLFHAAIPDDFIAAVFDVMERNRRHTFQVLTKRPARMHSLLRRWAIEGRLSPAVAGPWTPPPNVWLGVSVENQQWADIRIPALLETPAAVRFLSCEPLLGPVSLVPWLVPSGNFCQARSGKRPLTATDFAALRELGRALGGAYIDWVIAGGESGHGARPMHPEWARSIRDQCTAAGVPFLFKQWGEWAPPDPIGYQTETGPVHYFEDGTIVDRVGKKRAGRELDRRTWDEYPEAVPA